MKIEVNGVRYSRFSNATANLQLDALSNTFGFNATVNRSEVGTPFVDIKRGDACKVYADDELIVTGNVEVVEVSLDKTTHQINITGRDATGDFLDSSIGTLGDLKPPISLRRFIETIAAHIGTSVKVIDEVKPELFQEGVDLPSPEPGENCHEVADKYARKRGVLLTSDANGNIVIAQASGVDSGARIQCLVNDREGTNNIENQRFTDDDTGRFNIYRTTGQMDALSALAAKNGPEDISNQNGKPITDDQIRRGRQMVLVSEIPGSKKDTEERSQWEANIRKARGRVYEATVMGFRSDRGALWKPNQLVTIVDEYVGISAKMLVKNVEFVMDESSGRNTRIQFVERNAFTLSLEEPVQDVVPPGVG